MKIRPLQKADINHVIALLVKSFSDRYDQPTSSNTISDPNAFTLVVEIDNKIAGVASLYIIQKLSRKIGLIEDVAIEESQRGKGIGKLLVEELIKISAEHNCDKTILNTSEENVAFYEKIGFERKEIQMIIYH